jgi:DNA-binding CsgD family transcriptional regulator
MGGKNRRPQGAAGAAAVDQRLVALMRLLLALSALVLFAFDAGAPRPAEREILALLADGKTQTQIASALFVSPKTVSTHIQHVLAKLGVHSRAQAVAAAFKLGLVESDVSAHALPSALAGID